MPTFLFWNTAGNSINDHIVEITSTEAADVLILAEFALEPLALVSALNESGSRFRYAPGLCQRLHFFTRFDEAFLVPVRESSLYSIRSLSLPAREPILIAAVHLPSQLRLDTFDIAVQCQELANALSEVEESAGHSRTILIGDLNLNPFDDGVVMASGLNATSSQGVAASATRTVQGRETKYFYNPMWSYMHDKVRQTAGTYFYSSSGQVNFAWNTFDQVLIRPALLSSFDHNNLSVPTSTGARDLVSQTGRPLKPISDHLPVRINLNF